MDWNKIVNGLRWVGMIPVSILASWIVYHISYFLIRMGMGFYYADHSFFGQVSVIFGASLFSGMVMIFIPVWIAPSHKKQIIFLSVIFSVLLLVYINFIYSTPLNNWQILSCFSAIVGAIGGGYQLFDEN